MLHLIYSFFFRSLSLNVLLLFYFDYTFIQSDTFVYLTYKDNISAITVFHDKVQSIFPFTHADLLYHVYLRSLVCCFENFQ